MRRLWFHARRHGRRWAWGGAMLLLTNATSMAVPQLFRQAIDHIGAGGAVAELTRVAALLVLLALAGMVFRTLSRVHILFAARDVELDLRCAYYRHLTDLEPAFFQVHAVGDLMSRVTSDLTQVRLMLGPGVLNVVNTAVAYGTALPLMLAISPKLTGIAFLAYPPALYLMRRAGRSLYLRNRGQQEALGQLSGLVQENLAGAQLVRAFAVEDEQQRRFGALNDAYTRANVQLVWTRSAMFRISASLASVGTLAVVYAGAHDVLAGRLGVGDVVALVEYMALLSWPTFALGWVLSLWQRGAASMARLEEVLAASPRIASGAAPAPPPAPPPALRTVGLVLRFGDSIAIDGVSLEVAAGSTLGIVGPIGAGKSLLVRALMRLLEVAPGQVFVGGQDVTAVNLVALRRLFGYVPQNPGLFSMSIADNVAFGCPGASREAVVAATDAAALGPDLAALPAGLDTQVGERGVSLSGGQKQRVAIARAWALQPPVLVLDDALSAVDGETESTILANLTARRAARTTVLVAHRLSAVQRAEQIVVLDRGRLCEAGTHRELLARGGLYAAMARRQELQRAAAQRRQEVDA